MRVTVEGTLSNVSVARSRSLEVGQQKLVEWCTLNKKESTRELNYYLDMLQGRVFLKHSVR